MNIEIREVTKGNLGEILKLSVSESQKLYIESIEQCLKDALECDYYKPVGLYIDNYLVGFAMYGFFPGEDGEGRVWLDRFLIDKKYQGKGYGNRMLEFLIQHLKCKYNCNKIYLSLYDDNKPALHLYKKFGFQFNGELDVNKERVMVKTLNE